MKAKVSNAKMQKFYSILPHCIIVFFIVFSMTTVKNFLKSPFFSSGSGKVVNSLSESSKNSLIEYSAKLNNLIYIVKKTEINGDSSSRKKLDPEKSKIYRQEISKIHLKLADLVASNLTDISISHYKVIPEAKEMISGFKESAYKATEAGSNLSEFHPQSIGFISLGNSELTNAMSGEAKKELFVKVSSLNNLVKTDTINKGDSIKISVKEYSPDLKLLITANRQKIFKTYKEIVEIMSNDLKTIQINNPRIAPIARTVIRGLQESAFQSQAIGFHIVEFHPENINYFEP